MSQRLHAKQIALVSSLVSVVLAASGCGLSRPKYIDYKEDEEAADGDGGGEPVAATYAGNMQALITSQCGGTACHVGGSQPPDLEGYEKAKANGERSVFRVNQGTMPVGGKTLTAAEKARFGAWQAAGYQQ